MKVLVSVYSAIGFSSFGGFADDDSWAAEAGKLALALQKDQKSDFVQDFSGTILQAMIHHLNFSIEPTRFGSLKPKTLRSVVHLHSIVKICRVKTQFVNH